MLQSKEAYEPIYFDQDKEEHPEMSPGVVFGIDLLMVVEKEPSLHDYYEIEAWVDAMLKTAIRGKLPLKSILLIINRGLSALLATASARLVGVARVGFPGPSQRLSFSFGRFHALGEWKAFPKGW
jgi:hypothetical protein